MCGLDTSERVELKMARARILRVFGCPVSHLAVAPATTPDAILANQEIDAINEMLACPGRPGYGYS